MKLLVATDKGLVVYEWLNESWIHSKTHFIGFPVGAVHQQHSTWWVAINHKHWGPKIHRSLDEGKSWLEVPTPKLSSSSLKSIWCFESDDSRLMMGVEPAALFEFDFETQVFQEVKSLSEHPSRSRWEGGGKGSRNPFLHSIVMDSSHQEIITVGISCAGVFRSTDHGKTWTGANDGLKAYLPSADDSTGYDPHCIVQSEDKSSIYWQQSHSGIFRSNDHGKTWINRSDENKMADYGFAIVTDEQDHQKAWVIPAQSDDLRIPHDEQLAVYFTNDGGYSWAAQTNGLPALSFDLVLRQAFAKKSNTLTFGTNSGNLYFSKDYGKSWEPLSHNLSCVRAIELFE